MTDEKDYPHSPIHRGDGLPPVGISLDNGAIPPIHAPANSKGVDDVPFSPIYDGALPLTSPQD